MARRILFCTFFVLALAAAGAAKAEQPVISLDETTGRSIWDVQMPTIVREFLFGAADISEIDARQALLTEIEKWLVANFDLAPVGGLPRLAFASPAKINSLRYSQLVGAAAGWAIATRDMPVAAAQPSTVAIYMQTENAIYLPDDWTGSTPAEISVLVHEMMHHMQYAGGLTYECPQAREKLAFAAQEKWLGLFGRDLAGEFELDPFTVLVRSTCAY
jgi:hypothetical protein